MPSIPLDSFFAEHEGRVREISAQYPSASFDTHMPDYLHPFVDYVTLCWKIPDRELSRFNYQLDDFVAALKGAADSDQSWPLAAYSFEQGYNAAYEQWLTAMAPDAQAAEKKKVCDRFHAEHTHLVKGVLYFQIFWPNSADPQLVTPATWDEEGVAIVQRYNHRMPEKEHWLLPIAEAFAIYNPAKPVRYVHPEGGWLNYNGDEPTRDESKARSGNRLSLKGDNPPADPK